MDDAVAIGAPASGTAPGSLTLTCVGVRDETPTIKTFAFRADGELVQHEAGQAVTLNLEIDGETLTRTFSVSSAPEPGGVIEMTIKAHPDGRATAWLHSMVRPGSVLRGRGPRGRFTLARRTVEKLAFVSGGSGATPLMAMLRHLAATDPNADVAWFHAARGVDEILFASDLARLQEAMPNLTVSVAVSRAGPGWFGLRGRLSRRLLSVAIPDVGRRDMFCCGPAAFMQEAKLIYAAEGGPKESFHQEAFGPSVAQPQYEATGADPDYAAASYMLRVGERTLQVRADETILQASLRQGVIIPCGCGQGLCGTCRVSKVAGEVDMNHQGGLAPEEEQQGYILACSTRLRSDAEIRL
jgi:glycine betaine catabolism B